MANETSLQFAANLRDAIAEIARIVWDSHLLGLQRDGEWPEAEFFAAIVNQGFGGLHPRSRTLMDKLAEPGTYRLAFNCSRHNQQAFESITGADLAVVVSLDIGGLKAARRGFLVQLKRASLNPKKDSIEFAGLHHESGTKIFGQDLHQAERMLLFTDSAVFWLAVPPNAESDANFFKNYVAKTSLAASSARRTTLAAESSASSVDTSLPPWAWFPWVDLPEFEFMLHRWERFLGRPLPHSAQSLVAHHRVQEGDRLLRALRADAAAEATRFHGMRSLMSVVVLNAESVLGLRSTKSTSLTEVFEHAVALPEFILGNLVADAFGDDNPELIDAISKNRPNDYIFSVLRPFNADARLLSQAPLASATIDIKFTVDVPSASDRG